MAACDLLSESSSSVYICWKSVCALLQSVRASVCVCTRLISQCVISATGAYSFECIYLYRWTSLKAWWAAACRPCHRARHSGQCQALCSHSSPSLTATACDSHSAEGWHPELCQPGGEWQDSENISQLGWQEEQHTSALWSLSLCFRFNALNSRTKQEDNHCLNIFWLNVNDCGAGF